MNPQEAQLHYPFGDALPPSGGALEVAPGVKWLRMRLPFALDHINLWLLRDELAGLAGGVPGWTVVDCCVSRDEAKAQWEQIFANALEGLPILQVIVTHMHPDHIGLAHWLCQRWNAPLWISATDYHTARLATQSSNGFGGESAAGFFASHGLTDPESLALDPGARQPHGGAHADRSARCTVIRERILQPAEIRELRNIFAATLEQYETADNRRSADRPLQHETQLAL